MLTKREKFECALALQRALTARKTSEKLVKELSEKLANYVAETGDRDFEWSGRQPVKLTYVSAVPAKATVDAKIFMALASEKLSAADLAECVAGATRMTGARKASFR